MQHPRLADLVLATLDEEDDHLRAAALTVLARATARVLRSTRPLRCCASLPHAALR